jgi:hypothetical protein
MDSCAAQIDAPIIDSYAFTSDSQPIESDPVPIFSRQPSVHDETTTQQNGTATPASRRRQKKPITSTRLFEPRRIKSFFQLDKVRKRMAPKRKLNLMGKFG